jgi:hypothetical protein
MPAAYPPGPVGHGVSGATLLTVPNAPGVPQSVVQPEPVGVEIAGAAEVPPHPLRINESPINTDHKAAFLKRFVFTEMFSILYAGNPWTSLEH